MAQLIEQQLEPKLTQEQIEDAKRVFQWFDKNGDGTISTEELEKSLQQLRINPTKEDIRNLISECGQEGITFNRFLQMFQKIHKSDDVEKEEFKKAFDKFDLNGDGYIQKEELAIALTKLGDQLTDAEVDEMFRVADINGDNKIDFEEFMIMMSPK